VRPAPVSNAHLPQPPATTMHSYILYCTNTWPSCVAPHARQLCPLADYPYLSHAPPFLFTSHTDQQHTTTISVPFLPHHTYTPHTPTIAPSLSHLLYNLSTLHSNAFFYPQIICATQPSNSTRCSAGAPTSPPYDPAAQPTAHMQSNS
jgi:hypothetical protein